MGIQKIEVHGRIVEGGGLVDVEIETVVGLHLDSRLHARFRERGPRPAAVLMAHIPQTADLRQFRLRVVVLLRVVVAGNPPRGVVAGHRELGQFLLDPEADQRIVDVSRVQLGGQQVRKFVAEAQAVVVETEADLHHGRPFLC